MNEKQRQVIIKKNKQKQQFNCENKKRYQNETMAMASAIESFDYENCPDRLFYYRCDLCGGYHLTKSSGRDTVEIKR